MNINATIQPCCECGNDTGSRDRIACDSCISKKKSAGQEISSVNTTDLNGILNGDNTCIKYSKPFTWRDRLRNRLFPTKRCDLPDALPIWEDVLHLNVTCVLSFPDRIRVLLTGKLYIETRTVTEKVMGNTKTSAVSYPIL